MKYLELLSPAKDYETGVAAINHGADAIYIGAPRFGARVDAGNSLSDIEKLITYAHPFHVKVYVTVNTIIYDNELEQVKELIENIHRVGADAIIIQDMAILEMDMPPIPIFASTQTHNSSVEKVKFLQEVGFERVILARELSLNEIKEIKDQTNIDLEFFVHGALCVCYSGQCFFSEAITGRSANRGACAQPCRSSYDLIDSSGKAIVRNKHLLSLKDLNLSNYLSELIEVGITSFKIEGRLKDINYVKNITSHYNIILNQIIKCNPDYKRASSGFSEIPFTPDPERSFNRGFTTHFIEGRQKEQSSMDTQKSVGKRLGVVSGFGSNWFTIKEKTALSNGDGLCFINSKGVLTGIRVNRVDTGKIYPFGEMKDIKVGVEVYRNLDQDFNNALKSSNHNRWIIANIIVEQKGDVITFLATDEDGYTSTIHETNDFDIAMNSSKALENMRSQLSKSGDTIFKIEKVDINLKEQVFIPTSRINQIRRDLLQHLHTNRLKGFNDYSKKFRNNKYPFSESNLSYKGNVSNHLSEEFYKKHGVEEIEEAFEIRKDPEGLDLMVTRYCVKYELGICPTKQNGKQLGELYLRDNNNLYPLKFDCKNCVMVVKPPKKVN